MEKCRVLLIEDDQESREELAIAIREEGFEVSEAEDGNKGLEIFKQERQDIVISDLKLPDIDGLEVVKLIKPLSPNTQFILVTGFGDMKCAIKAIQEGVLDYIKKPIDLDQLVVTLGRAKEKIDENRKVPAYPGILLAEDDKDARENLCKALSYEDWIIYPAIDGEDAVKVFKKNKIDVALLDIKMPKLSGLETLHKLRKLAGDHFEAIILTGHGDESEAIQALRDGAINFLKKPIDLDELTLSIEKAMEKLNLRRTLRFRNREVELLKQVLSQSDY